MQDGTGSNYHINLGDSSIIKQLGLLLLVYTVAIYLLQQILNGQTHGWSDSQPNVLFTIYKPERITDIHMHCISNHMHMVSEQ